MTWTTFTCTSYYEVRILAIRHVPRHEPWLSIRLAGMFIKDVRFMQNNHNNKIDVISEVGAMPGDARQEA